MITKVYPLTNEDRIYLHEFVADITRLKKELSARKAGLQTWLDEHTGSTFASTQDRRWTLDYQYLVVNEREPLAPPLTREGERQ